MEYIGNGEYKLYLNNGNEVIASKEDLHTAIRELEEYEEEVMGKASLDLHVCHINEHKRPLKT